MFRYFIRSTMPGRATEWSWISQQTYFETLLQMEKDPDAWAWTQLARVEEPKGNAVDVYA